MKRLIYLKQEYVEPAKLNKSELAAAQLKEFEKSVVLFKEQMKELLGAKAFKILPGLPPEAILIEFAEVIHDKLYDHLRQAEVVDSIDSFLPAGL